MAAALLSAVPLAACSQSEDAPVAAKEVSDDTLAAALAGREDMSRVSKALNQTGLAQVFDGMASYTILAPTDAAFESLPQQDELSQREQTAALAAILREHVMPGALTPKDIARAVKADGSVEMQTVGGGLLTFSAAEDGIRVKDKDGRTAMLHDGAVVASNGVAIPVDGMLKTP